MNFIHQNLNQRLEDVGLQGLEYSELNQDFKVLLVWMILIFQRNDYDLQDVPIYSLHFKKFYQEGY